MFNIVHPSRECLINSVFKMNFFSNERKTLVEYSSTIRDIETDASENTSLISHMGIQPEIIAYIVMHGFMV